jgi:putative redox protein
MPTSVARARTTGHDGGVGFTKVATLNLTGDMRFEAVPGSGHRIVIDDGPDGDGPSPAELVGIALGGCAAMDVISILRKKRQVVTSYEIGVTGLQREEHPRAFIRFDVVHVLEGDLNPDAVRRAIELSARKYCSVGSTLATGSPEVHHAYRIRTPDGEELSAEVIVTGPNMTFEEMVAGT